MSKRNKPDPFGFVLIFMLCLIAWQVLNMFGCNSAPSRPDLSRTYKEYNYHYSQWHDASAIGERMVMKYGERSTKYTNVMHRVGEIRHEVQIDLKRINTLKHLR